MSNEIEIKQWLNSDLRIENKIKNLEDDMRNGFIYRDILMRLGVSVPSTVANKNDDATIKQNYTIISGILRDKLKITLQPKVGSNLEVLKQINKFHVTKVNKNNSSTATDSEHNLIDQFNKTLKTKDKHLKQSFKYEESLRQQNLPPKILDIETKLEKFRQQKLKSEILAKTLKDQEIERENQWRIEHRQFEINKTRANHQYVQDRTKQIYENWQKTQEVRSTRLGKEQTLNNYLTNRMKDEVKGQYDFEFKEYKDGLDYFKENCIQQGVSLRHDPDNYKPPPISYFNLNATMMRIKEKTHKDINARKDKEKRMLVEQQKYEKEIQEKKHIQDLLNKFCGISQQSGEEGRRIYNSQQKEELVVINRIERENQIHKEKMDYFDQKHEEFRDQAIAEEKERQKIWKLQKVQYMEMNLQEKIQKRKKHSKVCQDLIDIILDVTELCHSNQRQNNSIRVPEQFWRDLMNRFAQGKPLCDEQVVTIFEQGSQTHQAQGQELEENEELNQQLSLMFADYNLGFQMWQPFHSFEQPENQILNHAYNDDQLGDFLHQVIDKINPQIPVKAKPDDVPDHMPLRLSLIGNRFSGKKSIAQLIKQKYGLEVIDVKEVIDSAIKYAFPPPEDENDKKKAAAKKNLKKGQVEEEKPDNPQLRELGQMANEYKTQNMPYPDDLLVRAAIIQIKSVFQVLQPEQLIQQLNESKVKEQERQAQLKKEYDDYIKKKEKSMPKKGKEGKKAVGSKIELEVTEEPPQETYEEAVYRLMNQKEFEYSTGYVLVNFPQNINQAKLLEEGLTGFVLEEERLNPDGEAQKEKLAQLVRASEKVPDSTLKQGGLDLIINLTTDEVTAEKRASNRRQDPLNGNMYNLEDNLPPLEEKGLADRIQPINDPQSTFEQIELSNQAYLEIFDYLSEWYGMFGFEQDVEQQEQPIQTEQSENQEQVTEQEQEQEQKEIFPALYTKESIGKRIEIFEDIDQKLAELLRIKKKSIESYVQNYLQEQERIQQQKEQERLEQERLEQERLEQERLLQEKQQQDALAAASAIGSAQASNNESMQVQQTSDHSSSQNKIPTQNALSQEGADNSQIKNTENSVNQQLNTGDFFEKLKLEHLKIVMKMWDETQTNYVKEIKQSLNKLDNHREIISNRLADVQFRFLSVIQRPDDKQHKINTFQDNLNKFFEENPQMLRFSNTKEELGQHLETLYESLWDSVESKYRIRYFQLNFNMKNESIQERKTIMSSGWFDSEIQQLFSSYQRLFQVELNKLEGIIEIILYAQDVVEGRPINEVQEHVILDPFPNEKPPPMYDPESPNSYPRVDKMFDHFIHQVDNISELIGEIRAKFFKKKTIGLSFHTQSEGGYSILNDLYSQVVETEKGICKYRGYILKYSLMSRIKELKMIEAALYNKLDDWIIFGLKHENDVIYDAIRVLRQAIQTQTPIDALTVSVKNISDTYKVLSCFDQMPAYIQPLEIVDEVNESQKFTIFGIKLLFEELHTLCDKRDILNLKIFENVFIRRKKNSPFIPKYIKDISDKCVQNIYQNFSSQIHDDKIDFKDLMTCFILFNSPVPSADQIEEYKEQLNTFSNSGYIETHNFLRIDTWFDEHERDRNMYGQNFFNRIFYLKQLLFDLFCENEPYILSISQYIDCLKRLSSKGKDSFWQILFE